MKRAKIIKKLSLAYWEAYAEQLRLTDFAKKWKKLGDKKSCRDIMKQARKEACRLEGITTAAQALGVTPGELIKGSHKTVERR